LTYIGVSISVITNAFELFIFFWPWF